MNLELNPIALRPMIKKFQKGLAPLTNDEVRTLRAYYRVASDVAKADPALEGVSAYVNLSYQQLDRYFEARKLGEDVSQPAERNTVRVDEAETKYLFSGDSPINHNL